MTVTTETDTGEITNEMLIERDRISLAQVDIQIIQYLKLRHFLSARVGRRKAELGLPRTDLKQESIVIERYSSALGPYGASLAHDILRLSKDEHHVQG